jgi:hypothetical protein
MRSASQGRGQFFSNKIMLCQGKYKGPKNRYCMLPGFITTVINKFILERSPKAFHRGIIKAIPSPGLLDVIIPNWSSNFLCSWEQYWLPLCEWWISPPSGLLPATARTRDRLTKSFVMRGAIAYPTIAPVKISL